jgi:hypothetical protein
MKIKVKRQHKLHCSPPIASWPCVNRAQAQSCGLQLRCSSRTPSLDSSAATRLEVFVMCAIGLGIPAARSTSASSHLRPFTAAATLHLPWFPSPDSFRCPRHQFVHGEIFCLFYLFFWFVLGFWIPSVYTAVSLFYIFMCYNYRGSAVYNVCIVAKINLCSLHRRGPFIFVIWFLDLNLRTWYLTTGETVFTSGWGPPVVTVF